MRAVVVFSLLLSWAAGSVAESGVRGSRIAETQSEYYVSLASFSSYEHAVSALQRAESEMFGLVTLVPVEVDGRTYHRLVLGPHTTRDQAAYELTRLQQDRPYPGAWIWSVSLNESIVAPVYDGFRNTLPPGRPEPTVQPEDTAQQDNELAESAPAGYQLNQLRPVKNDLGRRHDRKRSSATRFQTDLDIRAKLFSTASLLPDNDIQRDRAGTPAYDHTADVRIMLKQDLGPVQLIVDHSTVALNGDGIELNQQDSAVDQTVSNDRNRRWDWTWDIEDGDRHKSFHRLDRLALKWQSSQWGVTVGREAVSWGNGIVFQPMDLFSPFSPTVVDRDYKAGDDLILIDRLMGNGHDLQLLHIARRDAGGDVTGDVSSSALKWHGYIGAVEFDVVAAEHYDTDVYAAATRFPIGQALVRIDLVASEDMYGDQVYSGVVNADISFMLADRNAYVFAEYFHNGWGVTELPDDLFSLPLDLQSRLARGEIFNLMKNYVALGLTYEWHPLINHSATIITNLHDNSSLFQTGVSYAPGDNQMIQLGWIEPLGGRGDEFGGIPVAGGMFTTGGASRLYARWVYYFGL